MTMIEKVARALDPSIWQVADAGVANPVARQGSLDAARRAIEAMREPTKEMHLAGVKAYTDRNSNCRPVALRDAYGAWIDAALTEDEK